MKQVFLVIFFVFGLTNFALAANTTECVMEKQSTLYDSSPHSVDRKTIFLAAAHICKKN